MNKRVQTMREAKARVEEFLPVITQHDAAMALVEYLEARYASLKDAMIDATPGLFPGYQGAAQELRAVLQLLKREGV